MSTQDRKQLLQQTEAVAAKPNLLAQAENACPKCRQLNEDGAMFCAECGAALHQVKCSNCSATARPRADICEVCGEWLLKGQCKFCYTPLDDDAAFCGECGNPAAGIICSKCGKLSIFDFCKACGIPLSAQAKQMVKETSENPTFKEIASLFEQLSSASEPSPSSEIGASQSIPETTTTAYNQDDQVLKLRAYRESSQKTADESKTRPVRKALFSDDQKKSINDLAKEVAQEEERRKVEEERRREHERLIQEQINEAMRKIGSMSFSSNQDARRFFMNIMASLPNEVADRIRDRGMVWRCNAYSCYHDSPGDCSDPSRGGVWLIR